MIECIKINKVYASGDAETRVLKDVSFKIEKGEFVAITGPSGSGKSTLMHIIGALDSPTDGKYLLEGQDVSELSDEDLADIRKNKIGFVFQSFNLLPRSTVIRNVILPLVYAEIPAEKRESLAKTALLSAGLEEGRWNHLTNQLSGGQMQRVAIARALVNNPSIILADEPTGNLDTKTGEIVLKTFRDLNKKEGHTIILITHEKDVAAYADRIIFVRDGVVVEDKRSQREVKK
ncbi:MAG: ABC transporter ATP-binding protein [Patescibacteria group bacterium]|jgi:putative ABC transport system ATP-binding protein